MVTIIFNGKMHSKNILYNILEVVKIKISLGCKNPCLAVILVGNKFASNLYVKNKIIACKKVNFMFKIFKLSKSIKNNDVIRLIKILNIDCSIHAIIVQLPLPKGLNVRNIITHIDKNKDVDILNPVDICEYIISCTPAAVMFLLKMINIKLIGVIAVVIGTSDIVGKPLVFELMSLGITVIIISRYSKKFFKLVSLADILIVAIGKPNFIYGKLVKVDSIVLDVGINELKNNLFVGDVDFFSMLNKVAWITSVPGGIGPITIAKLLKNTLILYLLA